MTLRDVISRVRRNHAIEHATVSLLMARGTRPPLGGYSTAGGFFIFGRATLEEVSQAAHEALARLRDGESGLAVSPFCGTNLVAGALLAGAAAALVMGNSRGKRLQRLPVVGVAAVAANSRGKRQVFAAPLRVHRVAAVAATMLARPVGNALQRRYTTLSDARGVEIDGVRQVLAGSFRVHELRRRNAATTNQVG